MRKLLLLFIIVLPFSNLFSQKTTVRQISGVLRDAINGTSVSGAKIDLYKRRVSKTQKGEYMIGSQKEAMFSKHVFSNSGGRFQFGVLLQDTLEYYLLKISKHGYNEGLEMFVPVTSSTGWNTTIELIKKNLSEKEKVSYLEKGEKEKKILELDKRKDAFLIQDELDKAKKTIQQQRPVTLNSTNSCTYSVPTTVHVHNLKGNGYNSPSCNNTTNIIIADGYINLDDYIAGVVQGEMGGITSLSQALKAQAVAARTYSIWRITPSSQGGAGSLNANCGQAYNNTPLSPSQNASYSTTGEVITYNGSIIYAAYSARCNGNYTQNSNQGNFSSCNLSGNLFPYLLSKPCSGHLNCTHYSGETPCCNLLISTANTYGNIYGHGVGLCQRGAEGFAGSAYNLNYCDILNKFYTGVCIANSSCSGGTTTLPNDDCPGTQLTSSTTCNYLDNQTVNNATSSGKPQGSCDAYTGTPALADVWYYFQAQSTSHTITVDPNGSSLDAVIMAYSSCTSNTAIGCNDTQGSGISTLSLSGLTIGATYYVRVYDYGQQTTNGDFRICVTHSGPTQQADLIVTSASVPSTITPGVQTTVSCKNKNQGTGNAVASVTAIWLSKDAVFDGAPTDINLAADISMPALSSGQTSSTFSKQITIPTNLPSCGTWYIMFGADALDDVSESDEGNNQNFVSFDIPCCTTPTPPIANAFGTGDDNCPGYAIYGLTALLDFSSTGGNTFTAQVSKYPYGSSNIIYTSPCVQSNSWVYANNLEKGMLYRWNAFAFGSTDCSTCQSSVSNTKYFHVPPEITSPTTSLCNGDVILTASAPNIGSTPGIYITYKWYRDGVLQPGFFFTETFAASLPGTYTAQIEFNGSSDCSGSVVTSLSNPITLSSCTSPLHLLSFNAKLMGLDVIVFWRTAQEINIDKYELERSIDGRIFSAIGSVKSVNNISETTYQFADKNIFISASDKGYYYRLKELEKDGSFKYSSVVYVKQNDKKDALQLVNTIFNSIFNVHSSLFKSEKVKFKLSDCIGRVVFSKDMVIQSGEGILSIDGLPLLIRGCYVLQIIRDSKIEAYKVYKE